VPPPRPARQVSNTSSVPSHSSHISSDNVSSNAGTSHTSMASDLKSSPVSSRADTDHRRFSAVSMNSTSDASGHGHMAAGYGLRRESGHSLSSQSDHAFLKPLAPNNLSVSVGVLVEKERSPHPKPRKEKQLNEVELPPRRQLHRSQSDLSSCRHSRTSSDFSDLSSRVSRTSTEVERFFNEMGIDRSVLEPMRRLSETKQKDCLDSLSSLDSLDGNSLSSQMSGDRAPIESEQDLSERDTGSTSVVERNARIIKWLCNVKKAKTVQTKPVKKPDKPQPKT